MSGDLPAGWASVPLGETGDYINGFAFKPGHRESQGKPIIRIQNLTDEAKPLNRTRLAVPREYEVSPGDMLVSWSATLDVFWWRREPALVNQHIFKVVPREELISQGLLYHWLKRSIDQLQETEHLHGSTMKHINRGPFLAHQVPLPPRAEQTRIVAKLDELLSDLDAGVAELKAAQKKLQQYRQSLLKAAVEGRLTAAWRDARRDDPPTETGADLLARILHERRERWDAQQLAKFAAQGKAPPKGWQAKYVEPVGPETGELPSLPSSWTWTSLGQCFRVAVGATPSRQDPSYWGGDIPWVSSGEVRFQRVTATKESISATGLANSSTQINPRGSVLLGMIGEGKTRGQVAILDIEAANNQNCAAIWVSETALPPEFVYAWLWSRYEETRRGSSGNNQPALNKAIVERMPLPLPPLEEAREAVRYLQSLLDGIEEQERQISRLLAQSTAQRQNLLRAAFAGQLVQQDPADEPAAELLARIRAERAGAPTKKSRRQAAAADHSAVGATG